MYLDFDLADRCLLSQFLFFPFSVSKRTLLAAAVGRSRALQRWATGETTPLIEIQHDRFCVITRHSSSMCYPFLFVI